MISSATLDARDTVNKIKMTLELGSSASDFAFIASIFHNNIISKAAIYRKTMDWDNTLTEFSQYAAIKGTAASITSGVSLYFSYIVLCWNFA